MTVVAGIALGHDTLRVAALVENRVVAVASMPAWVGFDGGKPRVGEAARALPAAHRVQPRAWLGRAHATGDGSSPGPSGIAHPIVGGKSRAPAELVAWLMRAAVAAVERAHGPVVAAVIATPIDLGVVERRALRDGAALAGVPQVRLIAEPALAALALPTPPDARWLVCDAGHSGVTLSLVELAGGAIDVVASSHEPELGGDALDRLIAHELGRELAIGTSHPDWPHLCAAARAVKDNLGSAAAIETSFAAALVDASPRLRGLTPPRKDEIELWCAPRIRKLDDVCGRVLSAAGLLSADLSEVVMVGGGARLTLLGKRLGQLVVRAPRLPADPAAAIALGAAQAGCMFVREPAALMVDVMPHALAIATIGSPIAVIAAGAVAPTRAAQVLPTTRADQQAIELTMWEETSPRRRLGTYRVDGLPKAPAGDALALCTITIDADLVPRLAAIELVSGAALTVVAVTETSLDAAAIAERRGEVTAWQP